jgi:acetyl esterase/lipase
VLADVYRANDNEVRPVIVWIHGGALIMGHREGINADIRRLAEEKGYALVSLDYRLAPETKLPEIISDIEAAFHWIANDGARLFHLDPSRIVVCGGSAGGYLTLVTGYRARPKPRALVAFWGYGDLVGEWYSKPSPHKRHNPREITRDVAEQQTDGTVVSDSRNRKGNGGLIYLYCRQTGNWPKHVTGYDPNTEAENIAPFEPVRNVSKDYPPTLLIHGTKDTDVPYVQSTMMADQFRKHGVPFQLESIENGEHGLAGGNPKQIKDARAAVREFIMKYLDNE